MLDVEDWAEIRRLHLAEGVSIKEISRRLGVARNTVRSAVRSEGPPVFDRKPRPSAVDAVDGEIRVLLAEFPRMPATVIAERIGWDRSLTILKDRVRELRPLFLPTDPSQRTEYRPGELAQWDLWFPAVKIPLGQAQSAVLPVIVGVSGYSRTITARMIPSREAHDILLGHLACLLDLGGVPRKGVYDNEAALISRHNGRPNPTAPFQRFRGTLGMGLVICKPGDPEAKGLVERANQYLETSFLPGRRFTSPQDFNDQLALWLRRANNRVHSTLRCRPSDRIVEDRAAMMPLPPVLPDPAWRETKRLGRDHWVRIGTCDYSVHPRAIGRRVDIRVDLDEVVVTCGGDEVARHPRSWAKHRTVTDADHERAGKIMRALAAAVSHDDEVEVRDLSVYDRATGVA
ncbi:MAG: IS21 family transposase [Gaiellaceae bacterium]